MSKPDFTKTVIAQINNDAPGEYALNTTAVAGDINRDGKVDFLVCGRKGNMAWLENSGEAQGWKPHLIDNDVACMECGGSLVDLTGNGYPDVIIGGDWRLDEIYWWENKGVEGDLWTKRLIVKTGGSQFHDTIVGDITGDGTQALIFTNQMQAGGTTIYYIPLPEDPYVSPWPNIQVLASGMHEPNPHHPHRGDGIQPEEGLAIGDVDGDGVNELVSGTHWFKYREGRWEAHKFAAGYISTKCAIGDIDGDGRNEILLSEGDPCIYGKPQGGKLAWFKPGDDITAMWREHILEDFMLDAHSLQLGDLCGNGRLDIFVGEVGKDDEHRQYADRPPRLLVFENDGSGRFTRHVIDEGTGTHDAQLADVRNRGVPDIIGKPLQGPELWNVHVWYNNRAAKGEVRR